MLDFAERLRATIAWNIRHFVREVIFVEWNPPADRELLSPRLTKEFSSLRAYVIPSEIHNRLCHNSHLPLLEYHAKNVGIRRAESQWVVATNADVAIGPNTIRSFSQTGATSDTGHSAWTAQRIDIQWSEFRTRDIGLMDCTRYRRIIPYSVHGTGDFLMASRDLWHRVRGYDESLSKHRIGCDVRGAAQMEAHGAKIERIGDVLHLAHPTSCTEGVRPHHGERASLEGVPYQNSDDWGLANCTEKKIAERVWVLE
jgi:hypothetical protein